MRDPDKFSVVEINRHLWRVMRGEDVVGQVRMGMDKLWYAEVGNGDRSRLAAVQRVILATQAIDEFVEVCDGCG